ncbi:hypothetical protein GCM10020227_24200 [Streptomyces flavovirens]
MYKTDAATATDKVDAIDIPDAQNAVASYPAATLKTSKHSEAAARVRDVAVDARGAEDPRRRRLPAAVGRVPNVAPSARAGRGPAASGACGPDDADGGSPGPQRLGGARRTSPGRRDFRNPPSPAVTRAGVPSPVRPHGTSSNRDLR